MKQRDWMLQDNLKVKVRVKDLIKALEDQKKKYKTDYEKDLKNYEKYYSKQIPKIAGEIHNIYQEVEDGEISKLNTGYRNKINIELKTAIRSKPVAKSCARIDNALGALRLSSDEFISLKQSDYNSYFC